MERLNKELEELLEKLKPYEFDQEFFKTEHEELGDGRKAIMGIVELQERGLLHWKDFEKEDGSTGTHFYLTSDGRNYRDLIRRERTSRIFDTVRSLAVGASGGLVVYLLSLLK